MIGIAVQTKELNRLLSELLETNIEKYKKNFRKSFLVKQIKLNLKILKFKGHMKAKEIVQGLKKSLSQIKALFFNSLYNR